MSRAHRDPALAGCSTGPSYCRRCLRRYESCYHRRICVAEAAAEQERIAGIVATLGPDQRAVFLALDRLQRKRMRAR